MIAEEKNYDDCIELVSLRWYIECSIVNNYVLHVYVHNSRY